MGVSVQLGPNGSLTTHNLTFPGHLGTILNISQKTLSPKKLLQRVLKDFGGSLKLVPAIFEKNSYKRIPLLIVVHLGYKAFK